ncbi:hypothetical protein HYV50_03015 [Candidatus Pacearchaeota archaeon]|nr:hypothetical protein [Candidatus Pacearchaeota archaeon]
MEELLKNAEEFLLSGEENIKKERFNVAVSDFFKAIVILCDYFIYNEIKIIPKNHSERFSLLQKYFIEIYNKVSGFFQLYTKSYNLRLKKEDAEKLKSYAHELKNYIRNKK